MKVQQNNYDDIDKLLFDYYQNDNIPKETQEIIDDTINNKIKDKLFYKRTFKVVAIFCTFFIVTATMIFGKDIVSLWKNIFGLEDININNQSVVEAIIDKDYIQNIEMDYIKLNNNYKIKVDYLMLDDINLYIVFNLINENNENKNIDYRISIEDLIISNENNECIYNADSALRNSRFLSLAGWKSVKSKNKEIQELLFIMTNGMPKMKTLKIEFSKLVLYDKYNPSKENIEINYNCQFNIEISEKFIDNEIYEYKPNNINTEKYTITKCIATNTGLYLLYKTSDMSTRFTINDLNAKSSRDIIGEDSDGNIYFITQFNITKDKLNEIDTITLNDCTKNIKLIRNNKKI